MLRTYDSFVVIVDLDYWNRLYDQNDQTHWPEMKQQTQAKFLEKTRDEWDHLFKHKEACVTPVLSLNEV